MKKAIPFSKLNGSGNDFLLIDNMAGKLPAFDRPEFVRKVCHRTLSVGADGVIFLEPGKKGHFRWDFYNADGSHAEMCGNGGRCAARFAAERKIAPPSLRFETAAGPIRASVSGRRVKLQMTSPHGLVEDAILTLDGRKVKYSFLNTGVPHAVVFVPDIEDVDVQGTGRGMRYHQAFAPRGTNVNFASAKDGELFVRTYERGVEGETLACGTGSVASAILAARKGLVSSPVPVRTRGGELLTIHFDLAKEGFGAVYLEGDTSWSLDGKLLVEAWNY